jgi:hypothetical protein
MITVIFPHKTYSDNKIKIKQIIKKYGMSWDDKKSGWVSEATGDGVFIDKSVMEMILNESFDENMPMTLFVKSENEEFLKELEAKCLALGGEFRRGVTPIVPPGTKPSAFVKKAKPAEVPHNVYMKLGIRDGDGCTTESFKEKAYSDLTDINARWERRKKELLRDYKRLELEQDAVDQFLQKDEITFRKNNACWVTGEFPTAKSE